MNPSLTAQQVAALAIMNTQLLACVRIGANRQTIDGQRVWNWTVYMVDGNEPIAGGYCATEADALNDARVWVSLNPQYVATAQN